MTQPTPTLPTPLAVPWTPPASAPAQPAAPQYAAQPYISEPAPQPQFYGQPQAQYPAAAHNGAPQAYSPQHPAASQAHQSYAQTPHGMAYDQSPGMNPGQNQPQFPPQGQPYQAQMVHPGQPPMPQMSQHMTPAQMPATEAAPSKSLLKSLLNRKPKAVKAEGEAKSTSGSLFDKNFIFGLAAGLVLGLVVLPLVFGGSNAPSATSVAQYSAPQTTVQTDPLATAQTEGESFVDSVLASDAP